MKPQRVMDCARCGFTIDPDEFLCVDCRKKVASIFCSLCGTLHSWLEAGELVLPLGKRVTTEGGQELHTHGCPACIEGLDHVQVAEFDGATLIAELEN